ncbi:Uncharacterised protein [Anaerococcus octavius]|uniref:Lipoprotein n=1 Tax=Anaerococcus octavius TaxID=54007 RepID=A0A380WYR3_9FIRM|nr:hypothetical protein [Anaerococcus octavius]SUU93322.1 Uncharacterised protein [Anaerococcus octavius]
MKKKFFLILSLGLLLTSCDFQARDEFEKQLAADEKKVDKDFKMPDISYEKAGEESSTNNDNKTDEKLDLTNLYGSGKAGTNLNPADAVGNIIDTSIGESQIGISLRPSSQVAGAYSTILSYKRNNELTEREFGPIAGINGLNTVVTFDKVSSDSGPMLLVSQVTINNGETYSAYYIFNKFMSLMDYLVFRTSTNDTTPTVERLDDIVEYTDQAIPGDLNKAIKNRMEAEDRYLPSLLDVYGINYKSVKSLYENKEMDIGYLPDITGKDRILLTKTTTSTDNMGMNIDMEK